MKGKNRSIAGFSKTIPSHPETIRRLVNDAMAYLALLRRYGLAGSVDDFEYRLALDESLDNALRHGNRCDPHRSITLEIEADSDRARITVRDEGEGFMAERPAVPDDPLKPGGRGLLILRRLYNTEWLENGRCVRIEV